jgi:phosphoribosyl 1,2-cyclic phosphodiesterase
MVASLAVCLGPWQFWWQAALDVFPRHGISRLDAVVITHSHNDAAYGLDDLRDLTRQLTAPLPVFIRSQDEAVIRGAFPYLFGSKDIALGGGVPEVAFHLLAEDVSRFEPVPGLSFLTLPVEHGGNGCLGFRIGDVSYISDAVRIPDETRERIEGSKVVVLDALRYGPEHPSHFTLGQACEEVDKLRTPPERVFFVGMNHEVEHEAANAFLRQRLLHVRAELAFDGLSLDVPLH